MEVIIIRHGQSESNAGLTLELDSNLTDLGRKQAQATAEYLLDKPIIEDAFSLAILVSPFRRTLQTARPLLEKTGLRASVLPEMCEYFSDTNNAYRQFRGLTPEQMLHENPYVNVHDHPGDLSCWWPTTQEDMLAMYRRAEGVRDSLYRKYFGNVRQVVLFSHAEPIGRLVEALLRVDPDPNGPPWTDNCGINRLRVVDVDKVAEVIALNDTSHLQERGIVSPG